VVACSGLAQFVLYTSWVLYTTSSSAGGRSERLSLAAVGIVSAVVQGLLLGRILKRVSRVRLAGARLASSALAYALWGAAPELDDVFAIIFSTCSRHRPCGHPEHHLGAADRTTRPDAGRDRRAEQLMAVIAHPSAPRS